MKIGETDIMEWKWNPKVKGSGIITCIPQKGKCPNNCEDCFFQSGRSYLEPLEENLPHIPPKQLTEGRIVRINDGNDSNVDREEVERTAKQFKNYFFNTAIPKELNKFSGPVVLTLNPGKMTDKSFHKLKLFPRNLMFVRFRTNAWNISLLKEAVKYYAEDRKIPFVITYMAYFRKPIVKSFLKSYTFEKRTTNPYWCLNREAQLKIEAQFVNDPLVYACGYKGTHSCARCGNCIREYYNAKERIGNNVNK